MRRRELNMVMRAIGELRWSQRREVLQRLKAAQAGQSIVEERLQVLRFCPHCSGAHIVRHGTAHGLQRYRCRGCGKTFNALTRTPLARLRCRERWLDQSQVLIDGLSITRAAERLEVARSTAFRWRHRFLSLPQHVRAGQLAGIVEADETGILKSCKGQPGQRKALGRPARGRGGRASKRGLSDEHDIVLVVRDRSGACTDQIVAGQDTAHLAAVLQPVLAADAVLCTDGSVALASAARHIGELAATFQRRGLVLSEALPRLVPRPRPLPSPGAHPAGDARAGRRGLRESTLNANSAQGSLSSRP